MRSLWIRGGLLQGLTAIMRLVFGVLFAMVLLRAFGTELAGVFWAKGVAYQIAFTLCGFGLPYGIVHRKGREYAFFNPEVKATITFTALIMALLLAGLWLMLDRDLTGASLGLHFFVNRLIFMVIFFRRNALEFEKALYQQLAYDISIIVVLLAAWGTGMTFDGFITLLLMLNFVWIFILFRTNRLGSQSVGQGLKALRRAFIGWRVFSARTYATEVIGLVLNGLDRLVLANLGHTEFLAVYVLARKFYEALHNIMTSQSSFIFAIMVKLTGQVTEKETLQNKTKEGTLKSTKLNILLSYEAFALAGYGLLALLMLQFDLLKRAGDLGGDFYGLVSLFLLIGLAQASLIPLLNITYAQGNAHFILIYTLANGVLGGTLLLGAWLQYSTLMVLMSQQVIVLTSWFFMTIFLIREFGLRLGGGIAMAKGILLIALNVWLIHSVPSLFHL